MPCRVRKPLRIQSFRKVTSSGRYLVEALTRRLEIHRFRDYTPHVQLFLLITAIVLNRSTASATFLAQFNVGDLAKVTCYTQLILLGLTCCFYLCDMHRRATFTAQTIAASLALVLSSVAGSQSAMSDCLSSAPTYITAESIAFLLPQQFWARYHCRYPRPQLHCSGLTTAGILGGLLGGLLVHVLPHCAVLPTVVCVILVVGLLASDRRNQPLPSPSLCGQRLLFTGPFRRDFPWGEFPRHPVLFATFWTAIAATTAFVGVAIDYYFKWQMDRICNSQLPLLTEAFGSYYIANSILMLILQYESRSLSLLSSTPLIGLYVMPLAIGIAIMLALLANNPFSLLLVRLCDSSLGNSLNKNMRESIYERLPHRYKYSFNLLAEGFGTRLGSCAAALSIYFCHFLHCTVSSTEYLFLLLIFVFVWLLSVAALHSLTG